MDSLEKSLIPITMAATNPQHMKEVLSKPHSQRKDFEVRMVVEWLKNTVRHFKSVNDNVMRRLVEEGKTETFDTHELIILEGDIGDVMYVLLTGKVSIYRKKEIESDDRRDEDRSGFDSSHRFPDRSSFGEEVAVLEDPGIIFGEIALIEDAPRSASIIANVPTQLFAVSRDLYERTVREVVEKEFRDKHDFINHTPCFQNWNPRYKKQLAMALQVANYDFDAHIARQGDAVKGIYYILRGQVRLSVVPHLHVSQYGPGVGADELERILAMSSTVDEPASAPQAAPVRKLTPTQQRMQRVRKSSNQSRPLEVCLLGGSNEEAHRTSCFGDTEVVLGFDTYLCSVTATEKTIVLELDMRSFDRLVLRRNTLAMDLMREDNTQRLARWLERTQSRVPFFRYSLERLTDSGRHHGKSAARSHSDRARNGIDRPFVDHRHTERHTYTNTLHLPPNGPLVDQYGPGTVFSYIRQKDSEMKARKAHTSRIDRTQDHRRAEEEERAAEEMDRRKVIMDLIAAADNAHPPSSPPVIPSVSLEESEDMINDLECRLRTFLSDHNTAELGSSTHNRYKLQITPMARIRKVSDPLPASSNGQERP